MNRIQKKRTLCLSFFFLTVLIILPVWSVWRQVRQERLNQDLIAAIKEHEYDTALSLLEQHADPDTRDTSSHPVSFRSQLLDLLHGRHGSPDTAPTALIVALETGNVAHGQIVDADLHQNTALIQALLDRGATLSVQDPQTGYSPFLLAAYYDKTEALKLLLERHPEINAQGKDGKTALMWMVYLRDQPTVQFLLDRGANINLRDQEGRTALSLAVANGDDQMTLDLLRRGADWRVKDPHGNTALSVARSRRWLSIVRFLEQAGAKE